MRKAIFKLLFLIGITMPVSSQAIDDRSQNFAVGAEVGSVVTITLQKNLTERSAIIGGVGSEWKDGVLYSDFLYYPRKIGALDFFFGPGAAIEFDEEDGEDEYEALLRLVAGASYFMPAHSAGAYGKIAPSIDTDGDAEFHFQAGLQYFF